MNIVSGRILSSAQIRDFNSFDQPNRIKPEPFNGVKRVGQSLELSIPPGSVIVLALQ
jgi:alpha-N-arabinofuranosidase